MQYIDIIQKKNFKIKNNKRKNNNNAKLFIKVLIKIKEKNFSKK